MKRLTLLAALLVVTPALALAQRPPADLKPDQAAQMYEDVEVLRRLLLRSLGTSQGQGQGFYTPPVTSVAPPGSVGALGIWASTGQSAYPQLVGSAGTIRVAPGMEGVFVKGHGVVYTVTLPSPKGDPRPDGARPAPKPDSEWERTRSQVRGEKPEPAETADKKEPSIGDRILVVLAKNGHRFSQLAADESITVVVVFRSDASPSSPRTTSIEYSRAPAYGPGTPPAPATAAHGQTDREHELLGDLHVKNGQIDQAIDAYTKAITVLSQTLTKPPESVRDIDRAVELLHKLAQAQLKAGKTDDARKLIDRIQELKKGPESKAGTPAKSAIPSRLTLSASKRLLDQAGQERITLDEFKKSASVDYQTFPPAAK